jgi:hypothetical protein
MRVDCQSCGKALNVPDDKVPARAFTLTCPGCQNKISVDPTAVAAPPEEAAAAPPAPAAAPPPEPAPAAPTAVAAPVADTDAGVAGGADSDPMGEQSTRRQVGEHDVEHDGQLAPLRGHEMVLMETLSPVAFVVNVGVPPDAAVSSQLQAIGMKEIRHFHDLAEACEQVDDSEAGVVLLRMDKAPAPPCEPLEPLYKMPFRTRRRTFVALMAENVRTLDGQVAFYLQVNCLIQSDDLPRLAVPLRRALLFHLRHYRYWWETQETA